MRKNLFTVVCLLFMTAQFGMTVQMMTPFLHVGLDRGGQFQKIHDECSSLNKAN